MENIEQLIFDYHEGNLSDAEKAELLNIIHQNPEYEKDFALWAQTYAHVPNNVPDYGLTGLLLQKAVPVWYSQYWLPLGIGAVSIIIGIIGFFSWFHEKDNNFYNAPKQEHRSPILEPIYLVKPQTIKSRQVIAPQKKQIPKAVNKNLQTEATLKKNIAENKELILIVVPVEEPNEKKQVTVTTIIARPDTLTRPINIINQTTNEEKMKRKPKRRLPLNLKPSPDFMPVNPNF